MTFHIDHYTVHIPIGGKCTIGGGSLHSSYPNRGQVHYWWRNYWCT